MPRRLLGEPWQPMIGSASQSESEWVTGNMKVISRYTLKSWAISRTRRWKGSLRMSNSVDFWYRLISRRATVPGRNRWGFFTPPVAACGDQVRKTVFLLLLPNVETYRGLTGLWFCGELLARCFTWSRVRINRGRRRWRYTYHQWICERFALCVPFRVFLASSSIKANSRWW